MCDHYLKRCNLEANEDRFYHVHVSPTLFGEWSVVIEWGRNGSAGTVRYTNWPSEEQADVRAEQLARKKLNRGYVYRQSPTLEMMEQTKQIA